MVSMNARNRDVTQTVVCYQLYWQVDSSGKLYKPLTSTKKNKKE